MNEDLGFSSSVFGFGAGIFFIGYFLFEVPSNLVLEKVGARLWIARVMVTWGLISAGMAFVQGSTSFYVLRFLLGAAEAGFFPGIILYLSYWFPARHRAGVTAFFMAAAPISTALGSPISAALLQMHGVMGLAGWQWMFIIEGIPAVLLGIVVLLYMTDRPEKAKWLAPEERAWLVEEMNAELAGKAGHASHSIWRGLADIRVLALALIYFGTSAGLYTLGIWAPQIIKQLGVSSMTVGFLNMIPPTVAIVAMVIWARHSDRTGERTWHVVAPCLLAAAGLAFAGNAAGVVAVVLALTIVNIGISSAKPPLWSMPTMFLSGSAAAAGIATINSIGNRRLRRPVHDRLDQGSDGKLHGRALLRRGSVDPIGRAHPCGGWHAATSPAARVLRSDRLNPHLDLMETLQCVSTRSPLFPPTASARK
jgi:ACS family tartrate transporter-like MFS transporter